MVRHFSLLPILHCSVTNFFFSDRTQPAQELSALSSSCPQLTLQPFLALRTTADREEHGVKCYLGRHQLGMKLNQLI